MTDQPKTCAHCGEPLNPTGKGRPAKVHPDCRAAYRADQKRAKRWRELEEDAALRGMTAEELQAERQQRSRDAWERKLDARVRKAVRRNLKYGDLMGAPAGPYTRGDSAPRVGRTVQKRRSGIVAYDPATGKLAKVSHRSAADAAMFVSPRVWKYEIRKATGRLVSQGIEASTAAVARLFLEIWEDYDHQAALDAMRDLDVEKWILKIRLDRIATVEGPYAVAVEAIGKAGIGIFVKTGDVAVLEAMSGIPGFRSLQDFRATTTQVEGKTLTVSEQFAQEMAKRHR